MSTKIYNGYKLSSDPLYLHQIQDMLDPVRGVLASEAHDTFAKQTISMAFEFMDSVVARAMGYKISPSQLEQEHAGRASSILGASYRRLADQIEEDSAKQRPNWLDPEVQLTVFTSQEGTYALLYTQGKHLTKVFDEILGAQEFNYWNNTDHDPDVPYDAWEKRGKLWDDLLGNSTPAESGATLTLVNKNLIHYPHPILSHTNEGEIPPDWIPDFDKRMYRLALKMPQAQLPPDLAQKQKETNSLSISVRHITSLERGEVPQFNDILAELKNVMPRSYTFKQLRNSVQEVEQIFSSKPARSPRP